MRNELRRGELSPFGKRTSALFAAVTVGGLLASVAVAAEISLECPAAGFSPALALHLSGTMLIVSDPAGRAELPAILNGDPFGMFTIEASGPMEAAMPVLADLEICAEGKLQDQGAAPTDADALVYVLNLCRLKLQSAATPQVAAARFVLTSMAAGSASLLISRSYVEASRMTGAPLQLDEWPMRQCRVDVR